MTIPLRPRIQLSFSSQADQMDHELFSMSPWSTHIFIFSAIFFYFYDLQLHLLAVTELRNRARQCKERDQVRQHHDAVEQIRKVPDQLHLKK